MWQTADLQPSFPCCNCSHSHLPLVKNSGGPGTFKHRNTSRPMQTWTGCWTPATAVLDTYQVTVEKRPSTWMHHSILLQISCSAAKVADKRKTEHRSDHASAAGDRNKKADTVSCDTLAASAPLSSELQCSPECSKWQYVALIQVPLEELKAFCRQ